MEQPETYTAVLDRFETSEAGRLAVLLIEANGEIIDERNIKPEKLPANGRHQDAVFEITIDHGELTGVAYDEETTVQRKENARSRFDRLSQRPDENDE